jgi:hypothetical protein
MTAKYLCYKFGCTKDNYAYIPEYTVCGKLKKTLLGKVWEEKLLGYGNIKYVTRISTLDKQTKYKKQRQQRCIFWKKMLISIAR